jgi:hypothetical protein
MIVWLIREWWQRFDRCPSTSDTVSVIGVVTWFGGVSYEATKESITVCNDGHIAHINELTHRNQ